MLYLACLAGAAGLYLLIRPGSAALKSIGWILGLGGLAWILVSGLAAAGTAAGDRPGIFFALFSLVAFFAAVRMITHPRPVYSALYFVLVVLASAGLFLLLEAEFMAFALVIVYAGAILITYVFVLMLAQQTPSDEAEGLAEYDAVPREPLAAAAVGFILLALLTHVVVDGTAGLPEADVAAQNAQEWEDLALLPKQLEAEVLAVEPQATAPSGGYRLSVVGGEPRVAIEVPDGPREIVLPEAARPGNVQRVGLALVARFPPSLELAGVILLMAMYGAVVLAREQIELGEDDTREAAGLPRFDFDREEASPEGTDDGGADV